MRTDRPPVPVDQLVDVSDTVDHLNISGSRSSVDSFEHVAHPVRSQRNGAPLSPPQSSAAATPTPLTPAPLIAPLIAERRARLIYAKSHVAIHPTQLRRDNLTGLLGLVEVDRDAPRVPDSDGARQRVGTPSGKEVLVVWVPDEMLARMSDEDRRSYQRVEERATGTPDEDNGFVFVSLPAPRGEKYAFSVPVANIYSILVYPPSLSHWYGSATFNLLGGVSLPTLFFHDDQTSLVTTPRSADSPTPPAWGFPPFLNVLRQHATLLRSRLLTTTNSRGGELWLINPSKSDREVHEAGYEDAHASAGESSQYPPHPQYPSLAQVPNATPRESLLVGLSNVTNIARHAAQNVLNHPLAKPVVPHLPPAFRSLVNVPGETSLQPTTGRQTPAALEYESARLYLARWARVVAEEGERSRLDELASQAGGSEVGEDFGSLGVFSLLPSLSKRTVPKPTRTPHDPITLADWNAFITDGRSEHYVRREIFRRGFTDSPEEDQLEARRQGWEVLLGVVPWSAGWVGGGDDALRLRAKARQEVLEAKRTVYTGILSSWRDKTHNDEAPEGWREEWHRIDVDARRTDRTQPLYEFTPESQGDEEKEGGGAGHGVWGEGDKEEEGGHAGLNPHIAALRTILMSYHVEAPELGYVQGMSDLLSPIYFVLGSNEADAYWGLVGVMRMMESNFLRDQSGMRRQLSTLQHLIGLMDPELYAHLDKTGSLNLFFCFRWILIAFKREFKFEDVIKLWEVLWTNYYSNNFVLFVALAVLQSHRDVIIRYLGAFDEVLKYANDLSGTIDLDTTLAQAEVLFLSFRQVMEEIDKENATAVGGELRRRLAATASSTTPPAGSTGSSTALESRHVERLISPEVRELLNSWQPESSSSTAAPGASQ